MIFVSPRTSKLRSRGNKTHCFPRDQSLSVLFTFQLKNRKAEKNCEEVVCLMPAGLQICRGLNEYDLIMCESKIQVVVFLSRVVRKPVNANPGLKVNRGNNFSCIKVLYIAFVLCSLRLLMLKTEGQKV